MSIKISISKKQLAIQLLIVFLSLSINLAFAQPTHSSKTKLNVVTHATGQCTNPSDSKAGLRLSAENGIDIDCNLRLSKVEFYANDILIGSDSDSPFCLNGWKPNNGFYKLEAKVFDNGQTKMSNPVKIKVNKN